MPSQSPTQEFEDSLSNADQFPINLIKSNDFAHVLKEYNAKLEKEHGDESDVFDHGRRWGSKAMAFFDYCEKKQSTNEPPYKIF
jgi:hypothetical protein